MENIFPRHAREPASLAHLRGGRRSRHQRPRRQWPQLPTQSRLRPRLKLISTPFPTNRSTSSSATSKTSYWRKARMADDKRARFKQWLANGEACLHPLTFPQRELWETSLAPPADVSNHICCVINVRGLISREDCVASLQRVVNGQEVLRLWILPGKNGPVQLIRARAEPVMRFRDISPQTPAEKIEELALQTFAEPFDLVQGPLYRVEVLRRSPDDQLMVFAIHHAIADGWTLGVFVQDLCAAYVQQRMRGSDKLPPVPTSYSAWGTAARAFWHSAELEPRIAFWKSRLTVTRLWSVPDEAAVVFMHRR